MHCNKSVNIKYSTHDPSVITFIRYTQNRKIGKRNNFKGAGSNKAKGPKQNYQNYQDYTNTQLDIESEHIVTNTKEQQLVPNGHCWPVVRQRDPKLSNTSHLSTINVCIYILINCLWKIVHQNYLCGIKLQSINLSVLDNKW